MSLLDDDGIDLVDLRDFSVRRVAIPDYGSRRGFVELLDVDRSLWVSQMTTGVIHELDWSGATLRTYPTHGRWPKAMAIDSGHHYLAVSNWLSDSVSIIDPIDGSGMVQLVVDGAKTPRGVAFTPDGHALLIAWFGTGEVTCFDTGMWSMEWRVGDGGAYRHVVVDPERPVAYVTDMARRRVVEISLTERRIVREARVGSNPNTLAISPDGSRLYVSCRGPNNPESYELRSPEPGAIYVVDAHSLDVLYVAAGGNQPTGLALSPDGGYLASTNFQDDDVAIYRIATVP